MKLSTGMVLAAVTPVLLAVAAIGALTYRSLEATALPRSYERVELELRLLTTELAAYVRGARDDIAGLRSDAAAAGIVRAELGGGTDPTDNAAEAIWRQRMAERFAAELTAKRSYKTLRMIGLANGHELVRVDRSGADGAVRIVPDDELLNDSDRDYLKAARATPAGGIYVSPVELERNKQGDGILTPYVPILRIAGIIPTPDAKPFGIVMIDLDMRPIFREIAAGARSGGKIYIVDDRGNYLLHADPSQEFGADVGRPTRWQRDFPALVAGFDQDRPVAMPIADSTGEKSVAGIAAMRLAGGPRVGIIEVTPQAVVMATAAAIGRSTLLIGLIAFACAGALAVVLARSVTRPLAQMTAAVEAFAHDRSVASPIRAAGEIGVLAGALASILAEIKDKMSALEREVAEHRRSDAELERHADRERIFAAAVQSSQDAIITMTLDGLVTGWNPAAARLFGWSAEEMFGRSIERIVPEDRRAELRGILEKIRRGETVDHRETASVTKERRRIEVSLSVSPIKLPSGGVIGACKIARDIAGRNEAKPLPDESGGEPRHDGEDVPASRTGAAIAE